MRDLFNDTAIGHYLKQFVNCWFEYVLSQPVSFDWTILTFFLAQYFGLTLLVTIWTMTQSLAKIAFETAHSFVSSVFRSPRIHV
jgi:hypothetical protein